MFRVLKGLHPFKVCLADHQVSALLIVIAQGAARTLKIRVPYSL